MKILIVGAGRTGCGLIERLAKKNYDITIIDKDKARVDALTDKYNISGVVGSGTSKESLLSVGADTADILFALTPVDEVNILSCMQAKKLGTLRCVARVFQPDFAAERKILQSEENIDYIFNSKYDMAEVAALSIGFPGVVKPEGMFGGYMQMINIKILENSPLAGKSLIEMRSNLGLDILVGTVLRDGKLYVPDGQFIIKAGDKITVASSNDNLLKNLKKLGIVKNNGKNVMIVGGGVTARYLIEMLLEKNKTITVIEADIDRCRKLMEEFPSVKVVYGEGELADILEEEGIASADSVVSLTNNDESNLVTSMFAWSKNVPSILTRVEAPGHLKLLQKVNLDITLSSAEISVDKLARFISNCEAGDAPNEIEKFYTIAGGRAEVMQFTAREDFGKIGIVFKSPEFKLKKGVLVLSILRNGELIMPNGDSAIRAGDKVIIVSDKKNHIENLNEILK